MDGSVMRYLHTDQATADAALARLRAVDCPDAAKVKTDAGAVVDGQQASDFTSASRNTVASTVTYTYDGGAGVVTVVTLTRTTQVGLGVVQTQVDLGGPTVSARKERKADLLSKRWRRNAVAANRAFGGGGSG